MPKGKQEEKVEIEDLLAFYETPQSDEILQAIIMAAGKAAPNKLLEIALAKRDGTHEQRGRAIYLLSRLETSKFATDIAQLTRDKNALVRACAIRALPKLDPKKAQEFLLEIVGDKKAAEIDVAHALAGLTDIGDLAAAAAIEDWAKQKAPFTLQDLATETTARIKARLETNTATIAQP